MCDRGGMFIGFQTRLCRVGCAVRTVYEHVIPRLVAIRPSLVGLIPRLLGLAGQVEVHNNSAISISPMLHDLARVIAWFLFGSIGFRRRLFEHDHGVVLIAFILGAAVP